MIENLDDWGPFGAKRPNWSEVGPKLLEALEAFSILEVKGHALIDRLQFSEEGRALSAKITAAIAEAKGLAA